MYLTREVDAFRLRVEWIRTNLWDEMLTRPIGRNASRLFVACLIDKSNIFERKEQEKWSNDGESIVDVTFLLERKINLREIVFVFLSFLRVSFRRSFLFSLQGEGEKGNAMNDDDEETKIFIDELKFGSNLMKKKRNGKFSMRRFYLDVSEDFFFCHDLQGNPSKSRRCSIKDNSLVESNRAEVCFSFRRSSRHGRSSNSQRRKFCLETFVRLRRKSTESSWIWLFVSFCFVDRMSSFRSESVSVRHSVRQLPETTSFDDRHRTDEDSLGQNFATFHSRPVDETAAPFDQRWKVRGIQFSLKSCFVRFCLHSNEQVDSWPSGFHKNRPVPNDYQVRMQKLSRQESQRRGRTRNVRSCFSSRFARSEELEFVSDLSFYFSRSMKTATVFCRPKSSSSFSTKWKFETISSSWWNNSTDKTNNKPEKRSTWTTNNFWSFCATFKRLPRWNFLHSQFRINSLFLQQRMITSSSDENPEEFELREITEIEQVDGLIDQYEPRADFREKNLISLDGLSRSICVFTVIFVSMFALSFRFSQSASVRGIFNNGKVLLSSSLSRHDEVLLSPIFSFFSTFVCFLLDRWIIIT